MKGKQHVSNKVVLNLSAVKFTPVYACKSWHATLEGSQNLRPYTDKK